MSTEPWAYQSFFGKLVKAKAIPMSPMDAFPEIKKDLVVDMNKPERLFNEEELQRIFSPKTFPAWAKKYPHRWWLPMISLYTGARINGNPPAFSGRQKWS
ncbi:hypothetical protein XAC71A_850001 [Xanthomonas citri pv. citri]|nr:hypothetical protein XAC71A_850001 [Xanthomonas citri pv. citri]